MRAHPDLAALLLVVLVAGGLRMAFAFRIPAFVTKDSVEYVEPALALVDGGPFVLAQRRTPVYPLFMAGSVALFGRDLLAITFAQHLLGIGTAMLTFAIGRMTFGRTVGLVGGLLAALSSPLLIYEHYLITESVFTFFLIVAICLFVAGLRTRLLRYFALGGFVLGLAALTRPVGQAILVVLPFAFLPVLGGWRPTLRACALTVGCFALLIVPWTIRNQLVFGEAQAASMGRFLISRSVKHERNFKFYDEAVGAYPGEAPERTRARKIAQEVTDKRPEPGQIFQRIRDNLGLTEAQTDAMLKDIALEAIMRDPMLWVRGTLGMFFELVEGAPKEESVNWHLSTHPQLRVANQWGGLSYLLSDMTVAQAFQQDEAEVLAQVFRPSRFAWLIAGLALVAGLAASAQAHLRPALLPFLVTFALIAASVALVGEVPRYRYPVDPLMYMLAAGGLASLLGLALRLARRLRGTSPTRVRHSENTSDGRPRAGRGGEPTPAPAGVSWRSTGSG